MHNSLIDKLDTSGPLGIHPFVRQKHGETSAAIACMIVIANSRREICIGYHMRGEVISVLSLERRYHILSRVSAI